MTGSMCARWGVVGWFGRPVDGPPRSLSVSQRSWTRTEALRGSGQLQTRCSGGVRLQQQTGWKALVELDGGAMELEWWGADRQRSGHSRAHDAPGRQSQSPT
jgi:hypothetical protein